MTTYNLWDARLNWYKWWKWCMICSWAVKVVGKKVLLQVFDRSLCLNSNCVCVHAFCTSNRIEQSFTTFKKTPLHQAISQPFLSPLEAMILLLSPKGSWPLGTRMFHSFIVETVNNPFFSGHAGITWRVVLVPVTKLFNMAATKVHKINTGLLPPNQGYYGGQTHSLKTQTETWKYSSQK